MGKGRWKKSNAMVENDETLDYERRCGGGGVVRCSD